MQQAILSSTRVRLGATPLWYGPERPASFQGCPTPAKAGARPSWQCLLALVMQMLNRGRSAGDSAAADLSRIQERQRSSVFMPPWSVCCDQRGKDGGGSLDCQCILSPLPGFDCAREGGASCCSVCHLSGAFAPSGRYRLYTHGHTHAESG